MKLLRHIVTMVCIVTSFITHAGEQPSAIVQDAVNQPTAVELQLLQGTWEGAAVGDKGTSKNPDFQETSERKPNEIDYLTDSGGGVSKFGTVSTSKTSLRSSSWRWAGSSD